MSVEDFISAYEKALATQDWNNVQSLIHQDACVTFSNGMVHKGKAAIKTTYEHNFSIIKSEVYSITNIHWVKKTREMAVYLFDFKWSGIINGEKASGAGRGTTTLVNENGNWQLIAEHLGPKA